MRRFCPRLDTLAVASEVECTNPFESEADVILLAVTLALLPVKINHGAGEIVNLPATQPASQAAVSTDPSPRGPTVSVHKGALTTAVDAQGFFEPVDPFEVRLRPKAYGGDLTITSVAPDGSAVKTGDVLLQLDPKTIQKQIAAAGNEAAASHAGLTRAQADSKLGEAQDALALKMQTDATQQAQDAVKWWESVDGPNMLLNADLNVKNAQASVDDQQDELNELRKLYKGDDLTTDTADIVVKRAVRSLENSKIALKEHQQNADKVKTYVYPARKQQVLDAAEQADGALAALKVAQAQTKVLRETGLTSAEAATKAVDEHLADLKADKEKLTIRAPSDGMVLYGQLVGGAFQGVDDRSLRIGERIAPQQTVMTFYTPGKLRLHLDLPESKFFMLKAGVKATLTSVAFADQKFEGVCDSCPALAVNTQQGPVFNLTASCCSIDPRIVPGMRANLHADVPDAENLILVPNTAIANGNVWVKMADGRSERHAVVAGKSDGKQTEIRQGLNEGEDIFVEAQK
jgi:HlyD family secretion protein